TTYRRPLVIPGSLANDTYRSITEDKTTGLLWLGASDGLAAFDPRTGAFATFLHDPADPQSLSSNAVNKVVIDPDQNFWALTENGLSVFKPVFDRVPEHRLRPPGQVFQRILRPVDEGTRGINFVRDGVLDQSGRLWLATRGGVELFDRATGQFHLYRRRAADSASLGDDLTQAIFRDRAGDIWVGTYTGGASHLRLGAKPFRVHQHDPNDSRTLSEDRTTALAIDSRGRLWASTGRGLNRLDATGWTRFLHDPDDPASLPANDLTTVAVSPNDDIWLGSNYGVFRYNHRRFQAFPASPSNIPAPNGWYDFTGGQVHSVLPDADGGVWLGARSYGLDYYREGRFQHFNPQDAGPGQPAQPTTNPVFGFKTPEGLLWFATEANGLVRLDPATGKFTAFQPPSRAAGVTHSLHCLAQGPDGSIWLGSASGLFHFDPRTERFVRHYTVADGLPHAAVVTIVRDLRGHLWLGTANGLARFDPATGKFRVYEKADGLPSNVFSQRCGVLGRDGRVYLGTRAGIVDFSP
ncbi:MAG TPA: two-component regulator propeller domain-containing protein, partial [Lacunisphaera sp.]|nr:two-component regulator propeller domain-containing protein [Lacunisphaera sp.]